MPKATLRAALITGAAITAIIAGTIPWVTPQILPALAQDTQPETPAPAPETPAADPAQPPAAEAKPAADPNQVVARVNGTDITRQEVIDSAVDLPEQIRSQIDMVFPQ